MSKQVDSVLKELSKQHPPDAWLFAAEVHTATGYKAPHNGGNGGIRSIDAFAMALWRSKDFERVAYEIKVNRSDWLRELKEPAKRSQAFYLSHRFYYVFIPGVFKPEDYQRHLLECGILEVHENLILTIHKAFKHEAFPMPESFIASLLRSARDNPYSRGEWEQADRVDVTGQLDLNLSGRSHD